MSLRKRIAQVSRTPPYTFQVKGVRFIKNNHARCLVADDMGIGKTYQTIIHLALHPSHRSAIIICPAGLKLHWQRELWHHARLESQVLDGRTPHHHTHGNIWIINYDILHYWLPWLLDRHARIIIPDECQRLINRSSKRSQAFTTLAEPCPHIIGLSGTPIVNRPIEFFPILHAIAPKVFPSYTQYAFRFCNPRLRHGQWDMSGATNLTELHDLVAPLMIRRMKEDVLDELPCTITTTLPIALSNQKEYDAVEDDFVKWLRENGGVAALKTASRAQAFVKMGILRRLAAAGKMSAIEEWIEDFLNDTNQKLVVFTWHNDTINRLMEKFGKQAVMINGSVPPNKRQGIVDKFQCSPDCRIFFGNLKAAGEGITLTAAATVCNTELGWNPATHDQAIDRLIRIGQKSKVVESFYFIGRGTVEEKILALHETKRQVIAKILDGGTELAAESVQMKVMETYSLKARIDMAKPSKPATVAILIWNVPVQVRHDFKVACASQGASMREAIVGLMNAYIKKYGHA